MWSRLYFLFVLVWEYCVAVRYVGDDVVSVTARIIPFLVDSMVVAFLSIVVGLVQIMPALSVLLVLLRLHVLSIGPRPLPLVYWIFF